MPPALPETLAAVTSTVGRIAEASTPIWRCDFLVCVDAQAGRGHGEPDLACQLVDYAHRGSFRGVRGGCGGTDGGMVVEPLLAAVRSRDAEAVRVLLDAGADSEVPDEHGTPVLCLAVDIFAVEIVEALVMSARLDRVAPDGRTALLRAVDRGAYDIMETLITHGAAMWHTDPDGRDALALARYWHETGATEVLRRRTSQPAPAGRRTVASSDGTTWEELSSGALTVRTGHSAILTALEPRYGITASFGELLARATTEPDVDHGVWWATTYELQHRHDPAVWEAAASLRARPDPLERYFGAEVLRLIHLFDDSPEDSYDGPLASLFLPWVEEEPDPRVVRALTAGLAEVRDPRAEQRLPALTRHPDARVRQRAVGGLHRGRGGSCRCTDGQRRGG